MYSCNIHPSGTGTSLIFQAAPMVFDSVKRSNSQSIALIISPLIIFIQKFLQSDWWRAAQFILNVVHKCEIECRKLKLVQQR